MTEGGGAPRKSLSANGLHRYPVIIARPRGIAIPHLSVDLREQLLHLLGVGVKHTCAGAVREGVDEFLGAAGDEVVKLSHGGRVARL
jgi:hypothetical protein